MRHRPLLSTATTLPPPRHARTMTTMKRTLLPAGLLLLLSSACGSTSDGTATIKITDDATISEDAGGDTTTADATSGVDGTAGDVSTLDVKAWPDGYVQPGEDVSLGDLFLEDAILDDTAATTDEDAGGTNLDVKAFPDGYVPDAGGQDALLVDIVVDVVGFDVTTGDIGGDTGNTDIKSLPDSFGTDAGPDVKVDTASSDTGKDTSVADVPVSCDGPGGCYACTPTTNAQLLNQCNDLSSAAFDNKARLPLLKPDGTLPPLP